MYFIVISFALNLVNAILLTYCVVFMYMKFKGYFTS